MKQLKRVRLKHFLYHVEENKLSVPYNTIVTEVESLEQTSYGSVIIKSNGKNKEFYPSLISHILHE